jgi:hypothetical protein
MSKPQQPESESSPLTASPAARACDRLGVPLSPAGLTRAADRGEIPFVRTTSGIRLYKIEDLEAFAKARLA